MISTGQLVLSCVFSIRLSSKAAENCLVLDVCCGVFVGVDDPCDDRTDLCSRRLHVAGVSQLLDTFTSDSSK